MSVTPGPNNLMLAASGGNFGFRRTLPHMLGISLGHALQVFLVGLFLAWIMAMLGSVRPILAVIGCGYLLWLSWKIWRSASPEGKEVARPMSFIAAAAFQWINPKAWVMVLNTVILFLPAGQQNGQAALSLALLCAAINLPCIAVWAWLGDALRHHLLELRNLKIFNGTMATLMALTAFYLLYDELVSLV
ncbi:LysE family translocator [Deefgea chitinilytica]|uniref:LysE family translocator n=2 Tax=Chitinibacteraceae TaxID=2897177 RepID=A0ABS2CES0_9NEIS|nr:LysE family translocator [Deefgea chitinilytica]MBM9889863.1 LysE family translocator [Deefgea sp. CFH1-16]